MPQRRMQSWNWTHNIHAVTWKEKKKIFPLHTWKSMISTVYNMELQLSMTLPAKRFMLTVGNCLWVTWTAPSLFLNSICGIISWLSAALYSGLTHHGSGRWWGEEGSVIQRCHLIFTPPTHFSLHHSAEQQCVTSQVCSPNRTAHPTIRLIRPGVSSATRYLSVAKKSHVCCCGFYHPTVLMSSQCQLFFLSRDNLFS